MRLQLDSASVGTGGSIGPAGIAGEVSVGASGAAGRGGGANSAEVRDSSSVSGTSSLLNNLATERTARIQQLTNLVQAGSYQVSSAAISRSLVGQAIS